MDDDLDHGAGRASFVVLIIVLLTVGVAATLWLSTQAIADSYRLDEAKQEADRLAERAAGAAARGDRAGVGGLARRAGEGHGHGPGRRPGPADRPAGRHGRRGRRADAGPAPGPDQPAAGRATLGGQPAGTGQEAADAADRALTERRRRADAAKAPADAECAAVPEGAYRGTGPVSNGTFGAPPCLERHVRGFRDGPGSGWEAPDARRAPQSGQHNGRRPGATVRRPVQRVAASGVPARGWYGHACRCAAARGRARLRPAACRHRRDGRPGPGGCAQEAARPANHHIRVVAVRFLLIAALVAAGLKLIQVQGFEAEALAAKAEKQRTTDIDLPANRGSIVDRNGVQLAFSVESRALAFRPRAARKNIATYNKNIKDGKVEGEPLDFDTETAAMAKGIAAHLDGAVSEQDLLDQAARGQVVRVPGRPGTRAGCRPGDPGRVPARSSPSTAPSGSTRASRTGPTSSASPTGAWTTRTSRSTTCTASAGLELLRDNELSGTPGRQIAATEEGNDGVVIPGTERDVRPAVDGSDIELDHRRGPAVLPAAGARRLRREGAGPAAAAR